MKTFAIATLFFALGVPAFAKDKPVYQVGMLQKHTQGTQRIGTDFSGIQCDSGRCVGSAEGIYATSNFWDIRVEGGYWELQPNWQQNSKHDPLNTAKEGDKILFRIAKKHFLNGTFDYAYLPRTDDPNKEIFLHAEWVPDHPAVVVTPQVHPKTQLDVACAAGKLTPDQQKLLCTPQQPDTAQPVTAPAPANPYASQMDHMWVIADQQTAPYIPTMTCDQLKILINGPTGIAWKAHAAAMPLTWAAIAAHCPDLTAVAAK